MGFCDKILVVLEPNDIVRVEDNGRGIPVDIHPTEKISALELVLTRLHAGGKFDKGSYKVSGGLHGVGVSVVNALSVWMEAKVYKDGFEHYAKFEKGSILEPVKKIGETDKISPKIVGSRYVVGVKREANRIGISIESYVRKIKDEIGKSPLSQHLKTSVLSHIDYHEFYDLGIIVITVPRQSKLSYYGEQLYWRKADSTVEASKPKEVEELARRFWNGVQVSS